jgi:hypothetical protein
MVHRRAQAGTGAMSVKADLAMDAAKAGPVALYAATTWGAGIDWGAVAAMMAALYSAILVAEKVYRLVIQPLWKRFAAGPAS